MLKTLIDLVGHRYGRITVIRRAAENKCGNARWHCRCDCGTEKVVQAGSLRRGNTKSCGCLKREIAMAKDLVGHRYGRYTVTSRAENKGAAPYWHCRCECGTEKVVSGGNLRSGDTKSCGCLNREMSMAKVIDMLGQRYGRHTVIRRAENKGGKAHWHCRCDCGTETTVSGGSLRSGDTNSCGCLLREMAMAAVIDLVGHRYGRLTVIRRVENKGERTCWLCRCDCGTEKVVEGNSLRRGLSRSCGCLNRDHAIGLRGQQRGMFKIQSGHCEWCHAEYIGRVNKRFCTPDCLRIAAGVASRQRTNADLADLEHELNRRLHDVQ